MTDPDATSSTPATGALEARIVAGEERLREALRSLPEQELTVTATLRWHGAPPEIRRRTYPQRLEVSRGRGRVLYLAVQGIDWIEAANQYTRIHAGSETHLVRRSLRQLEARLDPDRFPRVHRSAIVNVERVREIWTESPTQRWALLDTGERVPISGPHHRHLRAALLSTP